MNILHFVGLILFTLPSARPLLYGEITAFLQLPGRFQSVDSKRQIGSLRRCGFHDSGIQVPIKTEARFPSYRNAGFQSPELECKTARNIQLRSGYQRMGVRRTARVTCESTGRERDIGIPQLFCMNTRRPGKQTIRGNS